MGTESTEEVTEKDKGDWTTDGHGYENSGIERNFLLGSSGHGLEAGVTTGDDRPSSSIRDIRVIRG